MVRKVLYDDDNVGEGDYDEGEYGDSYGGDDEIDQDAMQRGQEGVAELLGKKALLLTEQQIRDALWDSYYDPADAVAQLLETHLKGGDRKMKAYEDALSRFEGSQRKQATSQRIRDALIRHSWSVDKSVAYIERTYIDPTKHAPQKKDHHTWHWGVTELAMSAEAYPVARPTPSPADVYFYGTPRINMTQEYQNRAVLSPPSYPGGLLGGKPSKLQALAAARKKKSESKSSGSVDEAATATSDATADALTRQKREADGAANNLEPALKRLNLTRSSDEARPEATTPKDTPAGKTEPSVEPRPRCPDPSEECVMPKIAKPTSFGATLFGMDSAETRLAHSDPMPFPYMASPLWNPDAFKKPSPDDIVTYAQSQSKALTPKGKQLSTPKDVSSKKPSPNSQTFSNTTDGLAKVNLNATSRPQYKNIDVVAEYEKARKGKKSTSFVVVGHVDAGKSTLMGRLLLELKFVDKQTVEKYRRQAEKIGKQSFELAWVMDQTQEERDRGVTMDIATNHFETEKTKFTILDAPGHRDFIPNMIAGASQADFAILVIDAGEGAFEKGLKGQTYEHVLLLRSIGIHRIIVAVNKMDTIGWSKDRFDEICQQVTGFLQGKRFLLKNISFVPIAGFDGSNVTCAPRQKEAVWYRGSTLLEQLDSVEPAPRSLNGPFRMAISEIWKSHLGKATMSGRLAKGTIQVGDAIILQPSGESGYIKSLMADNELREWAVAGENVSITVVGIDLDNVKAGDYACSAEKPLECGTGFTMKAMAFDHLMPMLIDLHRGRLHSAGKVTELAALLDISTGEIVKSRPKVVKPGEVARVRVSLTHKVPLEAGQRVVIRSDGETIAAGVVE